MLDYLIRGGKIFDGSGEAAFFADLGIKNGKIAAIGHHLGQAAEYINAEGCWVTPGFIDIHRHGDAEVFRQGFGELELRQGLTSVVNGACGLSLAPFGKAHRQELLRYLQPVTGPLDPHIPTERMADYLSALGRVQLPVNVGMMVGGGTLRTDAWGYGAKAPEDMSQIHRSLEKALQEGALAVSLGLGYAPECFYSTRELICALAPLAHSDIPICVHMREEGDEVCTALEEMIHVAKALRCPLQISHLKAMGMRNWKKKIPEALRRMEQAQAEGLDIGCDVYLYEAGSTQLLHLLPPDFLEGGVDAICERLEDQAQRELLKQRIADGRDFDNIAQMIGWDNIILSSMQLAEHQPLLGKTVTEAAGAMKLHPVDCISLLLCRERCAVTMIDRINCEEDIRQILQHPLSCVISDATYPSKGLPHPRVYGTYTRLFEKYVLQEGLLTPQEAVRKAAALPAQRLRLKGKGLLRPGMDGDVNVFRPEKLRERADFLQPRQFSEGMDYVFVAGKPAIAAGKRTAQFNGSVL